MGVKLYRDGKKFAIQTNCKSADTFTEEFSVLLATVIQDCTYEYAEWESYLRAWLPAFLDICNAMNGYKNQVEKEVVYSSGSKIFGKDPVHVFGVKENGEEVVPVPANNFQQPEGAEAE